MPAEIWREIMLAGHEGRAPIGLPGTTRSTPGSGAAPAPSMAPVDNAPQSAGQIAKPAAQSPPSPAKPAQASQPVAEKAAAAVAPRGPMLPKERIGEDFIARALALPPPPIQHAAKTPRPSPSEPVGGAGGFDIDAVRDRLGQEDRPPPPSGIMALGGRPQ